MSRGDSMRDVLGLQSPVFGSVFRVPPYASPQGNRSTFDPRVAVHVTDLSLPSQVHDVMEPCAGKTGRAPERVPTLQNGVRKSSES